MAPDDVDVVDASVRLNSAWPSSVLFLRTVVHFSRLPRYLDGFLPF